MLDTGASVVVDIGLDLDVEVELFPVLQANNKVKDNNINVINSE